MAPPLVVVRTVQSATHSHQVELGSAGDEPLGRVEHLDTVRVVRGDDSDSHLGPTQQVEAAGLGSTDVEPPSELGDQRSHDRALLLERPAVTEQ
jgi:hypothetical protein